MHHEAQEASTTTSWEFQRAECSRMPATRTGVTTCDQKKE